MFVIAGKGRIDIIGHEQLFRMARIFRRNEVGFSKAAYRAVRDVL